MKCDKREAFWAGDIDPEIYYTHFAECQDCQRSDPNDAGLIRKLITAREDLEIPDHWTEISRAVQRPGAPLRSAFRWAVSGAAAVIIAALVWFNIPRTTDSPGVRVYDEAAIAKVEQTEAAYLDAINALETEVAPEMQELAPQLAELYTEKLLVIEDQINRCREALKDNPGNVHIRHYMMAALKAKKTTYLEILELTTGGKS